MSKPGHIGVNACLVAASIAATLFFIEVSLRLTQHPLLESAYVYWRRATYESFFFHNAICPGLSIGVLGRVEDGRGRLGHCRPPEEPPRNFHAVRGWTDFSIRRIPDGHLIEDLTGAPWRGTQYVPYAKTRRRVILIGDSFIYGWNVAMDETIDRLLSVRLGDEVEVVTLGTRGYGLDQMVLVANEVIPQLSPDDVALGFIADDLVRSCENFSNSGQAAKPRFELKDGRLISPSALPTPYENYLRHREPHTLDAILARLYSVRVLALAMGPLLRGAQETCISKLNAALLGSLMKDWSQKTRVRLVHLDGVLPAEFMTEMAGLNIPYYSAPADIAATSQGLGVTADRHADGHPKAGLNAICAFMIYKILDSSPAAPP